MRPDSSTNKVLFGLFDVEMRKWKRRLRNTGDYEQDKGSINQDLSVEGVKNEGKEYMSEKIKKKEAN